MNESMRSRLRTVLDHFMPDEEQHYEQNHQPDNHIYKDLIALQRYLDQPNETTPTPPGNS